MACPRCLCLLAVFLSSGHSLVLDLAVTHEPASKIVPPTTQGVRVSPTNSSPGTQRSDITGEGDHALTLDVSRYARGRASNGPDSSSFIAKNPQEGRVLIISHFGLDRMFGAGVRQMALIMDLILKCGLKVDMLTQFHYDNMAAFGWNSTITALLTKYDVNVFSAGHQTPNFFALSAFVQRYTMIFVDLMLTGTVFGSLGFVVTESALSVIKGSFLQYRTALLLDDNPLERCRTPGHDNDAYCTWVRVTFTSWATTSAKNIAITREDADALNAHMRFWRIPGPRFEVWPMRMGRLLQLSSSRYDLRAIAPEERSMIVMIGTAHNVNKEFVSRLFGGGVYAQICKIVSSVSMSMTRATAASTFVARTRVVFGGELSTWVQEKFLRGQEDVYSCIDTIGAVSSDRMDVDILPRTRAIFNPVLLDIGSGISIKSFEAIANGIPLVTSVNGLRGLNTCVSSELLADGNLPANDTAEDYLAFISDKLLQAKPYIALFDKMQSLAAGCVAWEDATYPPSSSCSHVPPLR